MSILPDAVDERNDSVFHVTTFCPGFTRFGKDLGDVHDVDLDTGAALVVELIDLSVQCLVGFALLHGHPRWCVVNGSYVPQRPCGYQ